jgi:hypothetical protein
MLNDMSRVFAVITGGARTLRQLGSGEHHRPEIFVAAFKQNCPLLLYMRESTSRDVR